MSMKIELPDFEDMYQLIEEIRDTQLRVANYKDSLSKAKAEVTQLVTNNDQYWVGGKPPSVSYIKETYHIIGYDPDSKEILDRLSVALAMGETELDALTRKFSLMKEQIGVWRTFEANKRVAVD